MHEEIMEGFDALEGEHREHFAADLGRHVTSPGEMAAELRTTEQLLEGFCVTTEGVGLVALFVMNDCRERVRRAQAIAEQAGKA